MNKGHHQQMRQREPHRSQLLAAGRSGIEHAARDVEMRFGVPVIQGITALRTPQETRCAERGQSRGNSDRLDDLCFFRSICFW